jgi:hypothetical protein
MAVIKFAEKMKTALIARNCSSFFYHFLTFNGRGGEVPSVVSIRSENCENKGCFGQAKRPDTLIPSFAGSKYGLRAATAGQILIIAIFTEIY